MTVTYGALLLALLPVGAAAAPLKGPWDNPVAARAGGAITPCPAPPVLSRDIETSSFYTDTAHSVPDPDRYAAYRASVRPLNDAARQVAAMADAYRATGDIGAARCVATWLTSFARGEALTGKMSSNQAFYVQGWTLGAFAIDWLKVRAAPGIAGEARALVPAWLGRVAALNRDYYAGRDDKVDARNNHRYWAGVAVMASGIAADRRDAFDWGLQSARIGLRQVGADGTLPLEIDRRAKALHYHLFATTPLVTMAELAAANGIDAYRENNGALERLGRRALAGVQDPAYFAGRAGIAQEDVKRSADSLAWAIPFERRFPDPKVRALLAALPSTNVLYLGGSPPP
jgi:poly(beta-D-mannuronate) lyase